MNNTNRQRKPRRLTKAEIIETKERYRQMWEANRPRMLRLAELGRKAISDRHEQHRLWMREWLAKKPSHFSRAQLRELIEKSKNAADQTKTESYIKTMIRYGYIKFEDDSMLWRNCFSNL
jgi:hypothetical protein